MLTTACVLFLFSVYLVPGSSSKHQTTVFWTLKSISFCRRSTCFLSYALFYV